ncbi:MAG: phosphatidate cytidylyltransferase [Acidobacteria bacterium]|nr:phosphatidate cytidylyltransferase [Acidobacteriota bacterium]
MKRILTALVVLPILLYTVWSSIPYFFAALAAIAIVIAISEFYNLAAKVGCQTHNFLGYLAGLALVAGFVFGKVEWLAAVLTALVMLSLACALMKPDDLKNALVSVAATLFGVAYVALLAGFLVRVRMIPDTAQTTQLAAKLLTMFFAMVVFTDTGAYYTGRSLGKNKLAPRISPGKTIEGFVGGLIAAIAAGPLCRWAFFHEMNLLHSLLLGALIGLVGPVGDLAESMLKRGSEVKDSGTLLPGHGGMLDRVDSILFCAPLLYFYWRWFGEYF